MNSSLNSGSLWLDNTSETGLVLPFLSYLTYKIEVLRLLLDEKSSYDRELLAFNTHIVQLAERPTEEQLKMLSELSILLAQKSKRYESALANFKSSRDLADERGNDLNKLLAFHATLSVDLNATVSFLNLRPDEMKRYLNSLRSAGMTHDRIVAGLGATDQTEILNTLVLIESARYPLIDLAPEEPVYSSELKSDDVEMGSDHELDPRPAPAVPNIRRAPVNEPNIRGDIMTYAGTTARLSLQYDPDARIFRVRDNSALTRPHGVTGNLKKGTGNHLVPISPFLHHMERLIAGRDVRFAIASLMNAFSGLDQLPSQVEYDGQLINILQLYRQIIEGLNQLESGDITTERAVTVGPEADEFLRLILIPTIVAVWNQRPAAAFPGRRSQSSLTEEAQRVRKHNSQFNSALSESKEITEAVMNKMMRDFLAQMDYSAPTIPRSSEPVDPNQTYNFAIGKGLNNINAVTAALERY